MSKQKENFIEQLRKNKYHVLFGIVFVLLGMIALITPFTPGSVLFFIGLAVLGIHAFDRFFIRKKK